MKFSTQEEYGLRCLIRIGKSDSPNGLTIPEISEREKLSKANVGKILRILRLGGFIESTRGQNGGYKLSRSPEEIVIGNVLASLGGKLFEADFCKEHAGFESICTHTIDCSIRSLWKKVQDAVDNLLGKTTLKDLMGSEEELNFHISSFIDEEALNNSKQN
jgi:Rrf2 family protein